MRRLTMLATAFLAFALMTGCPAGEDAQTADTAEAGELARFAGTWDMTMHPETGDSTIGTFQLVATDSRVGWSIRVPDREPIPIRIVDVQGNTVTTEAGPYESILHDGVQVRTRGTFEIDGDRVTGTTEARYQLASGDSVARIRTEGMRAP